MTAKESATRQATPIFASNLPDRTLREGRYELDFARSAEDLDEVLKLRFEVFNLELGEGLAESFHHLRLMGEAPGIAVGDDEHLAARGGLSL